MKKTILCSAIFLLLVSGCSRKLETVEYYKTHFTEAGAAAKECESNNNKTSDELQNCKNAMKALKEQILEHKTK
jgi:hypothetical protein